MTEASTAVGGVWATVAEIAAGRGISKQAVHKRLKGLGDRVETRTERGRLLVNRPSFDLACGKTEDPAQALRNPSGLPGGRADDDTPLGRGGAVSVGGAYKDAKAEQAKYQAEFSRLDLLQRRGETVDRATVEEQQLEVARRIRSRLMLAPAQMAERVAHETGADPIKLRQALLREMRAVCADLAEEMDEAATDLLELTDNDA